MAFPSHYILGRLDVNQDLPISLLLRIEMLAPQLRYHLFPAELQLACLVGTSEADNHRLGACIDESLQPTDRILNVAGEDALRSRHGFEGHVVITLYELPHLLIGLGLVFVYIQCRVYGPVQTSGVVARTFGQSFDLLPPLCESFR